MWIQRILFILDIGKQAQLTLHNTMETSGRHSKILYRSRIGDKAAFLHLISNNYGDTSHGADEASQ